MNKVTCQTKVPHSITLFCDAMGFLFGQIERGLYKAVQQGEKLNQLKRENQIELRIDISRHVWSAWNVLSRKLLNCAKRHSFFSSWEQAIYRSTFQMSQLRLIGMLGSHQYTCRKPVKTTIAGKTARPAPRYISLI
ncbi:MAG: hypothetical protein AB4426_18670 [Xenococcaceae cyanobacterium]